MWKLLKEKYFLHAKDERVFEERNNIGRTAKKNKSHMTYTI